MKTRSTRFTAAPIRRDAELARFESIDCHFTNWARDWGAEELQFPALIDRATLERAEYPSAFPHLLLSACACADPALPLATLLGTENLAPTGWLLSPAVCYHIYPGWEGDVTADGRVATARGRCFRREHEFVPGRRQLEFEMREIVLCGAPTWLDARIAEARTRIETLATQFNLIGTWETAVDPFFLPTAQGKAYVQRLHETKQEFVVRNPSPLAIASINRHGTFFAERFHLGLATGGVAHTACIAFGLDRWASASRPATASVENSHAATAAAWRSMPPCVQAIHARLLQRMPQVVAPLRPDMPFSTSGGDSIDFVEFLCAIDADYGVRLTTDDLTPLQTVGELLELVGRRALKRPLSPP